MDGCKVGMNEKWSWARSRVAQLSLSHTHARAMPAWCWRNVHSPVVHVEVGDGEHQVDVVAVEEHDA